MRLKELDVLRGIAALSVMLFHYTSKYRQEYGHDYPQKFDWPYGHYGVQLFFVISGFVIFLTLHNVKSTREFAYKRFTRLYPTYWICLLLTFAVISFWPLPGREVSLKEAVIGLSMIQQLFQVKNVDGVYWTLLPELLFYIMMGTLFYFKLLNHIKLIGTVWMILILINSYHLIHYFEILINLNYGMYFYAGIIFYKIKFDRFQFNNHLHILFCFIVAIIVNHQLASIISTIIIFSLFYLFVYNKLGFLSNKPLFILGFISYPLYLIHQNIGFEIIRHLKPIIGNDLIIILLAICFVLFLAWVITYYIEKPILRVLRKKAFNNKIIVSTNV